MDRAGQGGREDALCLQLFIGYEEKRRERYGENMEERRSVCSSGTPFEVVISFYSSGVGAEYLQCRQVWLYRRKIKKTSMRGKCKNTDGLHLALL